MLSVSGSVRYSLRSDIFLQTQVAKGETVLMPLLAQNCCSPDKYCKYCAPISALLAERADVPLASNK